MIDIKATGLCEGCIFADIETECTDRGGWKTWRIKCTHEEACDRASDKSIIEQDDVVLLGIKTICEQYTTCEGCRYYITQRHDCGIGHPHKWKYFSRKEEGGENV